MDFTKFTKEQLAEAYEKIVGYNPFVETITVQQVSDMMNEYDAVEKSRNFPGCFFQEWFAETDSFIKSTETVNTGGHIYNDVITLKNGTIIRISEDLIGIYKDEEADEKGEHLSMTKY